MITKLGQNVFKTASLPIWKVLTLRDLSRRLFPSARAGQSSVPQSVLAIVPKWVLAVLETLLFCFGALLVRIWFNPTDPYGLSSQFPWLWIVPALLAMRYGTAIGITAVLSLLVSWFILGESSSLPAAQYSNFPESYFLGGLILILVCGQFSDVWSARSRRLRAVNAYLSERLNTLTNNHFLLRLSHERLEQDLLAKPLTLRETLVHLRNLMGKEPHNPDVFMPGAVEFIQLIGQSCQLEIAAVYACNIDGSFNPEPAAFLGAASGLAMHDPLVRFALEQGVLAHVQTGSLAQGDRDASQYLICAPLLCSDGEQVGLLVVEKLPFFALNSDTLKLLSVLIGYYADSLRLGRVTREIFAVLPDCPPDLALDLIRLHRIKHEAGIDSSLVALVFENTQHSMDLYQQVKRLKRGVDLYWEITGPRHNALITLLPLASSAAVEGYLLRIDSAIKSQFGTTLLSSHVVAHTAQIGLAAPQETLKQLVERCAL